MTIRNTENAILTFSGIWFWPLAPQPEEMKVEDIAHALSQQCRFTGHTREFYSVAQHCVLVSYEVPKEDALWGLMHDATEAYLMDMSRPVKGQMPEFKAAEKVLEKCVALAFKLPTEIPESVHQADRVLLMTEKRDLMPPGEFAAIHGGLTAPLPSKIQPWSPTYAEKRFLLRFNELVYPNAAPVDTSSCSIGGGCCGIDWDAETYAMKTIAERIANSPTLNN